MMAPEFSSRPPEQLERATIDAVRSAFQTVLHGDSAETLRPMLQSVAKEARDKAIPPEQLLVTLKEVWYAMPEIGNASVDEKTRQLQRIVTMCIREYYA